MKSIICAIVLIASLSAGNSLFAQGRGRAGGPPAGVPPAGPAKTGRPSGAGTTNRPSPATDHTANGDVKAAGQAHGNAGKQIGANPVLDAKLQGLLPQGTDVDAAAGGFRNMGQFVAAVHVSNNLNIPFDQVKAKMVTGHMSLGEAIHALKPDLSKNSAKAEAKKAEDQSKQDSNRK